MKPLHKRQFFGPPGDESYIAWAVERDPGDPTDNYLNMHTITIHDGRSTVDFTFWNKEKAKLRNFRKLVNAFCDAVEDSD